MKTLDIGVIFPSRGLCFSETLNELLDELEGIKHTIYWSHGNSLPDCFNKPLETALNGSHSHIWIVEDDMVLKKGILKELLSHKADIAASDYPVSDKPSGSVYYDNHKRPLFTGTGCILIKTKILKDMPKPVFRADIEWGFGSYGDKLKFTPRFINKDKVYGYQDVNFGLYHYINGNNIAITKTILAQRRLKQKGTRDTNQGQDIIYIIDKHKVEYARKFPKLNVVKYEGRLKLLIVDGREMWVNPEVYEKLIGKKGVVRPVVEIKDLIIETNDKELKDYFNLV